MHTQQTKRNALPRTCGAKSDSSIAINFAVPYLTELTYADARAKIAFLPVETRRFFFSRDGRRFGVAFRAASRDLRTERDRNSFAEPSKLFPLVAVSLNHNSLFTCDTRRRDTVGLLTCASAPSENSATTENEKHGGGRSS